MSIDERLELIKRKIKLRGIQLESPIPEAEVAEFERKANVTLPEGYRRFITEIGNGGEGPPSYGLFPFPEGLIAEGEFLSLPFVFTDSWIWSDRETDDEICTQTEHGNLHLGEDGCGMYWLLVITGPERGKVWDWIDFCVEPCPDRRDFLTWYDDWLNGRDDRSIPCKPPISDEEFFEIYTEQSEMQEPPQGNQKRRWWQLWGNHE